MNAKIERCPSCGDTAETTRFAVCAPCAALLGWEPECAGCRAEEKDADEVRPVEEHLATCRPGIGFANLRRAAERRRAQVAAEPCICPCHKEAE